MNHKKNLGFTLIELLVAIIIIGILATLTTVVLNSSKQKGRDTKRVADVRAIHDALEMYVNDQGVYPSSIAIGQPLTAPDGTIYMNKIPFNPSPYDTDCDVAEYEYTALDDNRSYSLQFCLEGTVNDIGPDKVIADPTGFINFGNGETTDACNNSCSGATPFCLEAEARCVECLSDSDCGVGGGTCMVPPLIGCDGVSTYICESVACPF